VKRCGSCKNDKDISEFHRNKKARDGHRNRCKECVREYHQMHYAQNKQRYVDQSSSRQKKLRDFVWDLKRTPCFDCKIEYPPWVMQFDHLRDKDMGVGKLTYFGSKERILREAAKCEIVCANCHAIRTHNRRV